MTRPAVALIPLLALVACAPRTTFNYTVPATYSLPEGVQLLATVDSPETRESDAALDTMLEVLTDCARVKTVPAAGAREAFAEHPVARGAPIPPLAVKAISGASKTSGLLVLDRVEDASQVDVQQTVKVENRIERRRPAGCDTCEPREEEVQVERPWFDAVATHTVTVGWQIYGANGELLTSWSTSETYVTHGEGESASMARENLDEAPELLRAAAEDAAYEASKHICPWTNSATRRYFRCGSDEVRAGAKLARDGKWEDAKSVWETGTKDGSVSARGKAYLDLAVAYEREGKVGKALKNAEEAAKLLDKGWVDAYVDTLRGRTKQQKRLKEQMDRAKPTDVTTPGAPPPATSP